MIIDNINKFRNKSLKDYEKQIACYAPFQAMHVNKKGKIKPCPFSMPFSKNLQEQWSPERSLKECWDGFMYEKMREDSISSTLDSDYCNYCVKQCEQNKPPSSLDFDWVGGRRDVNHEYPQDLELELSNTCNYMCEACSPWCSSQWTKKLGLESDQQFESIFDDPVYRDAFVADLKTFIHKIHRINFTGGEPFAQPAVYAILKMIEEEQSDVNIHFTTNGSVMNGAVKKMAKRPNTSFTVSLDSIDPETYPKIRVNGIYEEVMHNINYLLENCSGEIGASFVLTKSNINELPSILSWCNEKGIVFSYHILANMGGRNWKRDLEPISIESENKLYLSSLRKKLIASRNDIYVGGKYYVSNMKMYDQYIERLK